MLQHFVSHNIQYNRGGHNEFGRVDYTVGGDHGKGRFPMITKLILRYSDGKLTLYNLFQIANVDYAKDNISVLRKIGLDAVGVSLQNMMAGGSRFVLYKQYDGMLDVQFSATDDKTPYCNVPAHMFCVGDLKFYAQMLGHDNYE